MTTERLRSNIQGPLFARRTPRGERRGAILMLIAFLLPVFVIVASFAINIAWVQLVRTELRTATDAAARAGAKVLSLEQNIDDARAAAADAASRNLVAGQPLQLANNDIVFGSSQQVGDSGRFYFTPGGTPTNSLQVRGRRTSGSPSGPVDLFFSGVLGVNHFEPTHAAHSAMLDRDISLVIDRSGSMGLKVYDAFEGNGQNCGPMHPDSRFVALAGALDIFLDELDLTYPNEQVALVSYSSSSGIDCGDYYLYYNMTQTHQGLTMNYNAVRAEVDEIVERGVRGGTAVGRGLRTGIQALDHARPLATKTIVLMTDGRHNTSTSPVTVAYEAEAANIVVHTVTFSSGADQALMQQVAGITGGRHFHADTAADLGNVFREIARTLPVMLTE